MFLVRQFNKFVRENTWMRYRFYREHKYITFILFEIEKEISLIDFSDGQEVNKVINKFDQLSVLIEAHSEYENKTIHCLLKDKNIQLYNIVESDHSTYSDSLRKLNEELKSISINFDNINIEEKIERGYNFYINFRYFVALNLEHFHQEETLIMPELQRLYSDLELRQIQANAYNQMHPSEIISMLETLFPHMNHEDYNFYLSDLKYFCPEKFNDVWNRIAQKFEILKSKSTSLDVELERAIILENLHQKHKDSDEINFT